ncbi:hypothetical protein RY27_09275, partial [Litorilinea aerophila]
MKQIIPGLWAIDEIGAAVHSYLWLWDEGLTLIDTGFPRDAKTILHALFRHGHPPYRVRPILVTHSDLHHPGGPAMTRPPTLAPL